jgi:hypothetical protein
MKGLTALGAPKDPPVARDDQIRDLEDPALTGIADILSRMGLEASCLDREHDSPEYLQEIRVEWAVDENGIVEQLIRRGHGSSTRFHASPFRAATTVHRS